MAAKLKQIAIVGSGNWGSVIAKIAGDNTSNSQKFEKAVLMYVYEEVINGKNLSDIINEQHENIKYLPGIKLPANVLAEPDLIEATKEADILIFVFPHLYVKEMCTQLAGKIKPTAVGLSLIKGFDKKDDGTLILPSHVISQMLKIPCHVMMGANIANEVAAEKPSESTLGCSDKKTAQLLRDALQTDYFNITIVEDEDTCEVCGALKNIVAMGAGFVDGLDLCDNTKAAVLRQGLMEIVKFVDIFNPGGKLTTFFESCGVPDLIISCFGGRNRKCAEAFVRTGKSVTTIEKEMFNGQRVQGPATAEDVNNMLKIKGMEDKFPLFTAIHKICCGKMAAQDITNVIKEHPQHIYIPKHIVFSENK